MGGVRFVRVLQQDNFGCRCAASQIVPVGRRQEGSGGISATGRRSVLRLTPDCYDLADSLVHHDSQGSATRVQAMGET
eukprot:15460196-Alexandrium_andersonii.AAC.1